MKRSLEQSYYLTFFLLYYMTNTRTQKKKNISNKFKSFLLFYYEFILQRFSFFTVYISFYTLRIYFTIFKTYITNDIHVFLYYFKDVASCSIHNPKEILLHAHFPN